MLGLEGLSESSAHLDGLFRKAKDKPVIGPEALLDMEKVARMLQELKAALASWPLD